MKVELLEEIGVHGVGAIVDVEDIVVNQLVKSGKVKRHIEQIVDEEKTETVVEQPKRKGNPNWAKK